MRGSTGVAHREKHVMKLTNEYSVDVLYEASLLAVKNNRRYEIVMEDKRFGYIRIKCMDMENKRNMDILIFTRYIDNKYSELVLEVQLRDEVKENYRNLDMADILLKDIGESLNALLMNK